MSKTKFRDVARGLVLHLAARLRRRILRCAPVSSLADEIGFAEFCRCIGESNSPELEAFLASSPGAWPDPFFDLDDFPDEMHEC